MSRSFHVAYLLILVALGLATSATAIASDTRVVQEVVLIRHGIRSPTAAPEKLAIYADQPWPAWDVAPGQLTAHGAALMRSWGAWYREHLTALNLTAAGCDNSIKLIADSTPRNRDSAAALWQGFAPGCHTTFDALPPDQPDPLFQGVRVHSNANDESEPSLPSAAMAELQKILLGCNDQACLNRASAQGKQALLMQKPAKALKLAGTLAENLMLQYVQGMPLAQVGWGRADAAVIERIIVLHNASFAAEMHASDAPVSRDGNLLAHVAATLATTAKQSSSLPSLATSGERSVVLVGHDTDLAAQASLLQLNWHNPAQPDDYTPATALIWQLLERHGQYRVRMLVVQPTLTALRAGNVQARHALVITTLHLPACDNQSDCPLSRFTRLVANAVPAAFVAPASGNEPPAQP